MSANLFPRLFPKKKSLIGMVHVFEGERRWQVDRALGDLARLQSFVEGVIVENYGWGDRDANCATEEARERIAEITSLVVRHSKIPVGVNLLPNDYEGSFLVADAAGGRFIQLDHVTGRFVGCKSVDQEDFLWYRHLYPQIAVLGGIHPKYYTLINPHTPLGESAKTAKSLADAVVVTGAVTGGETSLADLTTAREALGDSHPLIVGSGLNAANARVQLAVADAAIVGTAYKKQGVVWGEPVDTCLARQLYEEVEQIR